MINKIKAAMLVIDKNYSSTVSEDWNNLAHKIHDARKMKAELELQVELWTKELTQLSYHKNTCGEQFYFHQIERKGSIEYALIPELKLIDIEKYRKASSCYWKLEQY
jgi:hypothetical protein